MSGQLSEAEFYTTYSFLDDMRKRDNRVINRELKQMKKKGISKDDGRVQKLKQMVSDNKGGLKIAKRARHTLKAKAEVKKNIREGNASYNRSKWIERC